MSDDNQTWGVLGRAVPRSEVVFCAQVVLIYIVVIASIVNLSIAKEEDTRVWLILLSSSLGYLLPSPNLKKHGK